MEPQFPFSCRRVHIGPVNCRAFNLDFFKAYTSASNRSLYFKSHVFCLWRLDKKTKTERLDKKRRRIRIFSVFNRLRISSSGFDLSPALNAIAQDSV